MFSPGNPKLRYLYVIWGFLECLGYGGLTYGWGSLVYVLKQEGLYQDLCANVTGMDQTTSSANSTLLDCHERSSKLELVFTVASTCIGVGSFVLGQISFKYGTRSSRIVASIMFICGAFLVAFTSNGVPWLIFIGMSLLSFGGIVFIMTNLQIAHLFPVGGAAVVGLFNGAYDTSAGIQLLVKFGYENGITRKTSYLILACTHVLTFISTFLFLPKDYIHSVQESDSGSQEIPVNPSESSFKNIETEKKVCNLETEKKEVCNLETEKKVCNLETEKKVCNLETGRSESVGKLVRHVLTPTFLLHVFWLSTLQLRFYCLLGSMNPSLEKQLKSQEEVSAYTNVLLYIMMGGIVVSPLAGAFVELNMSCSKTTNTFVQAVQPTIIPLALTTTLCVVMSVLIMFENPSHLYYIFALLLVFRSFLYTVATNYLVKVFPSAYLGSLIGILMLSACSVGMIQHAMFEWAGRRDPMEVNIFLLVLSILTYIHPAWQWKKCLRPGSSSKRTMVKSGPLTKC